MGVDLPPFSGRLEKGELPEVRLGRCEVVGGRYPVAETCEDRADPVSERIVVELGHAEEAFGERGDHATQNG